jgi:hypothetical protein
MQIETHVRRWPKCEVGIGSNCLVVGIHRKRLAYGQNDAIDPRRKSIGL